MLQTAKPQTLITPGIEPRSQINISKYSKDKDVAIQQQYLKVLLDKLPNIETPMVWELFLFGCIINSTYSGGLPKLKSLDLGACTVPWGAIQFLGLK